MKKENLPPSVMYDIFKENDTVAVFIDGFSFMNALKTVDIEIDWCNFRNMFRTLSRVRRMHFYLTSQVYGPSGQDTNQESPGWIKLQHWLQFNSFQVTVRTGPLYHYNVDNVTRGDNDELIQKSGVKSGIEVCIATDLMMEVANGVDHIVLCTTNEEYEPLVVAAQSQGATVSIIANSTNAIQSMRNAAGAEGKTSYGGIVIPRNLIKQADNFIEIGDLRDCISNEKSLVNEK